MTIMYQMVLDLASIVVNKTPCLHGASIPVQEDKIKNNFRVH